MYGNTRWALVLAACVLLPACTVFYPKELQQPVAPSSKATLTPAPPSRGDLASLPPAKGQIVAAVYSFRDMTGQYKPQPDSSYSTVLTQGGTSVLMKALLDSNWFIPVEREGLQNLMTERRIVRNVNEGIPNSGPPAVPNLLPASIIIEGGIVGYETNVRTGGAGLRYYGIGFNDEYRTDQITISLRVIDVRTGRIISTVNTTKAVYSQKLQGDVFRYVKFKRLLEAEVGVTRNEPVQLCLQDAVEAGVTRLVALGIRQNLWTLRDTKDMSHPLLKDLWIELGLDKPDASMQPIADLSKLPPGKPAPKPAAPAPTTPNGNTPPPVEAPGVRDAAAAQMPTNAQPSPQPMPPPPKAPGEGGW